MIPFVNLERQHASVKAAIDAGIAAVIDRRSFINGPFVRAFETAFSNSVLGGIAVAGCSNGTSALALALEALGIGPGDEVITVAATFVATAEAICHVGATPVFVDIEPGCYGMAPAAIEAAVTSRTRAILPVHLYGAPCDMDGVMAAAARHGLRVVEDCAQAHLATHGGRRVGGIGDAAGFSFFPGKNLGAFGDAGAVVSRHPDTLATARRLLDHGRTGKYEHDRVGYNYRMDDIQAAVLSAKLPMLAEWTERRRANAKHYDARLKAAGFKVIEPLPNTEPVYHLYVVEVSNRDPVKAALAEAGIAFGVHYPLPLHRQPAFSGRLPAGFSLPVTEHAAQRVLSLPICGSLTADEVDQVCDEFLAVARP